MGWAKIASMIAGQAVNQLGKKSETDDPGFESSGWANEKEGVTSAPVFPEKLETKPKDPQTKWEAANNFLGSNVGDYGAKIGGAFLSDFRQRRNTKKHMEYMESKGLSPWEAAGSGAGGPASAYGSTLGTGPANAARNQQTFIASEREKDRQNELKKAQITSGPAYEQAYQTGSMNQIKARQLEIEIQHRQFELKNKWPMIFAHMSEGNMIAAMASKLHGVDSKEVLESNGIAATPEKAQQLDDAAAWMMKHKGLSANIQGVGRTVSDATANLLGYK